MVTARLMWVAGGGGLGLWSMLVVWACGLVCCCRPSPLTQKLLNVLQQLMFGCLMFAC